jgi:hypothetical protein
MVSLSRVTLLWRLHRDTLIVGHLRQHFLYLLVVSLELQTCNHIVIGAYDCAIYRFVRTSQGTHYVSARTPAG